jgi:hypothetical protein
MMDVWLCAMCAIQETFAEACRAVKLLLQAPTKDTIIDLVFVYTSVHCKGGIERASWWWCGGLVFFRCVHNMLGTDRMDPFRHI